MPAPSVSINCNPWARELYGATERYIVLSSGRSAGKDYETGIWLCWRMLQKIPIKAMCCRQYQSSIAKSIKALFEQVIEDQGLSDFFTIQRFEIKSVNGSVIHFEGADRNPQSIKGWQGYDICIINEAQSISSEVWEIIKPTIRKEGSQIVVILNPRYPTDAVAAELLGPNLEGFDRTDVRLIRLSYEDNIYLSETTKQEIEVARQGDPVLFSHIWGGGYDLGTLANPFSRQSILAARRDPRPAEKGKAAITAVDVALTESQTADYTVAIKADMFGNLLDFQRIQQSDYKVQVSQLQAFVGDTIVMIDSTGVGRTIAQMLSDYHNKVMPVQWSLSVKREMIGALSGYLDANQLAIPTSANWDWLQEELLHYERKETATGEPTTKYGAAEGFHDDGVSALMMYAHYMTRPKFDTGVIDFGNQRHW